MGAVSPFSTTLNIQYNKKVVQTVHTYYTKLRKKEIHFRILLYWLWKDDAEGYINGVSNTFPKKDVGID